MFRFSNNSNVLDMKGFIEVSGSDTYVYLVNISNINYVGVNGYIFINNDNEPIRTVQSYEQIKQLIKKAQ